MWDVIASPKSAANAHSAAKMGLYGYNELHASRGTQPLLSGVACVQLEVGATEVVVGMLPELEVVIPTVNQDFKEFEDLPKTYD